MVVVFSCSGNTAGVAVPPILEPLCGTVLPRLLSPGVGITPTATVISFCDIGAPLIVVRILSNGGVC